MNREQRRKNNKLQKNQEEKDYYQIRSLFYPKSEREKMDRDRLSHKNLITISIGRKN